ncbi:MAG: DCC1-like thiol-disulfide oxidoreductase family protein [bacterium]|nr:DCC1-like thiol-disulfide oxidoreductase family protein [bacterium]
MEYAILIFDGVCNFCNGFINFIIDLDHKKRIKFLASQSENAKEIFKKYKISPKEIKESIIFIEDERYTTKSTAFFHILKYLPFPYFLLYAFIGTPRFIRDAIYDYIARNRYKWFGKRTTCRMPTKELKERFLY